jgi:hypothetical protein
MGSYVTEKDIRNFFSPPLDYDDISKATIDLYIESVEDFVESVYFNDSSTTAAKARLPCLLLIASKIVSSPSLAKTYNTISEERLGDYYYKLGSATEGMSPHAISKTWEQMGLDMLRKRTTLARFDLERANE